MVDHINLKKMLLHANAQNTIINVILDTKDQKESFQMNFLGRFF